MKSILTKEFLETILMTAKRNLMRDGYLCPVAFVRNQEGAVTGIFLDLPLMSSEKQGYMIKLGVRLRTAGVVITEAFFVAEGWFVIAANVPSAMSIPPSQHPARREAITIVGRNAEGTQTSSVVQVFSRDRNNKPVCENIAIAIYNQPMKEGDQVESLLDYLFIEPKGGD